MLVNYLYGKIILGLFMIACAIDDARKKMIDYRIFIAMLLLTLGGYIWMVVTGKEILWLRIGIGVLAGATVWLVGFLTKEQIGYGDAAFFTLTGLVLGCKNVLLLVGTMLLGAVVALVICAAQIVKGKKVKNKSYPLLPIAMPVGMAVMLFA